MGIGRQIFKHTAIYSVGTVLGRLASFILLPFYTHIFEAEGYGVIAMVDTSVGFLTILLTGGFQAAILRIYHEQEGEAKKWSLGTGICIVWILGILIVLLPIIFSRFLSTYILGDPEYYIFICLALIAFVIDVSGQSASTIQIIKQKSILFSVINLLQLFIGIFLNIWLVVFLNVGLIGVFISSLATAIFSSSVFHLLALRENGLKYNRDIAIQLLRFQIPLLPGEIISFLGRQAEKILVRILIGLEGMGVLEIAYKFPPLINLFITIPFQRAWRTKSIEIADQKDAPYIISLMFTRYFFLIVFVGLILAVSIENILNFMTPSAFWPAARISQIEIVTTIIGGCINYLSFGILYQKKTIILSLIKSILAPIKIILGFIFISSLGLAGAAYSALIIEIIALILIVWRAQILYKLPLDYLKFLVIIIVAIGIFLLLDNNDYTDYVFGQYISKNWFPALIDFIKTTPLNEWKSGKLIKVLQEKQHELISLILNPIFSCSFLILLPFVSSRFPEIKSHK
ncbi:MAG: oligosaccharide flippase family protein [Candidatus Competibacteraceae bacterium]|nr:oligosaccharide flippase family protein [Candidatus Competibacteraceae bacterium]